MLSEQIVSKLASLHLEVSPLPFRSLPESSEYVFLICWSLSFQNSVLICYSLQSIESTVTKKPKRKVGKMLFSCWDPVDIQYQVWSKTCSLISASSVIIWLTFQCHSASTINLTDENCTLCNANAHTTLSVWWKWAWESFFMPTKRIIPAVRRKKYWASWEEISSFVNISGASSSEILTVTSLMSKKCRWEVKNTPPFQSQNCLQVRDKI